MCRQGERVERRVWRCRGKEKAKNEGSNGLSLFNLLVVKAEHRMRRCGGEGNLKKGAAGASFVN